MFIGIGLRPTPSTSGSLIAYAANSITPQLVADFKGGVYGKNSALSTFANVLNHTRNGNATLVDADGLLKWAPHNLFTYSEDLSGGWGFRSVDVTLGQADPDGGTGAILLSPTGADIDRVAYTLGLSDGITRTLEFIYKPVNAPGPDFVFSVTGNTSKSQNADVDLGDGWTLASWEVVDVGQLRITLSDDIVFYAPRLYRSDLGGMVNNPATGNSYVPTTDAARYLPRENHHVYNGSAWVKEGYLHEPETATNLLLNNGTLSTQNVTVTAVPNTLHFTGTGTVTLSGTATDGPLVGTGTGENNRVNLTFTPSAGTLTVTVSGTVTNAQLEVGSVPTSDIPTAGSTVTRAADTLTLPVANIPYPTGANLAVSIGYKALVTYADTDDAFEFEPYYWAASAAIYVRSYLSTTAGRTGQMLFVQRAPDGISFAASSQTSLGPGINVPVSIAGRYGSTFVNGAIDGTALTADTTPTEFPDLSTSDLIIAPSGGPQVIQEFIMWGGTTGDIGDTGIEETSA